MSEDIKTRIKSELKSFWKEHPDFDDRNPIHVAEAQRLLERLKTYPIGIIIEAIEELREEAEVEIERARERFYRSLEIISK